MEKIPNIQATKEYQFAKEVERMLNNYQGNRIKIVYFCSRSSIFTA